jgi:uncharacterized protein YciI
MAMFLILLTYVRPLDEIDRLVDDHNAYLERNYDAGRFIVSGRREPRIGGVIIAHAESVREINATVAEDPFVREGVAEHEVIEFVPSKWAPGFEALR